MPSFIVNPGWYEAYWYSEGPHHKRKFFSRRLARFGAIIVLLAGSEVVLHCFHG
jgi:hypothetical protein